MRKFWYQTGLRTDLFDVEWYGIEFYMKRNLIHNRISFVSTILQSFMLTFFALSRTQISFLDRQNSSIALFSIITPV